MNNKKGFTLIELLAVIVVLAIVTVIATQSILPFMSNARPDAFRVEATELMNGAENAIELYSLGEIDLKNNTASCKKGNEICFTVKELIDLGIYKDKTGTFSGKVLIDITNKTSPSYKLYFQKGAEFNITGGTETDYVNNGTINDGGWSDADATANSTCSCS